jgi:lipopolysaccharide export system permease protein
MRLLDRYLLRELLAPLAYCLSGFSIFWISFDAFKSLSDFQDDKLHLLDIIQYYFAMTPEFIVTVLPIALLLALLYALTHHARHNEITAMRAAGVSLWRVSVPYFLAGFLASLALFALNEFFAPHSADWANRILNRHVQKAGGDKTQNRFTDFVNIREHRLWHFGAYRVETTEMLNPIVSWTLPDGSVRQLTADRAIYTNGVWTFLGAKEFAQTNARAPLLPSFQTDVLPMPEFSETPKEIRSESKINEYQGLRASRRPDIPLAVLFAYLRLHPDLPSADSNKLLTKLYGRLAAPWTCLVVVFIAIPFGATSGRRNLFFGVAGSIFICFTFFVLQQVGLALGMGGRLPAWLAAWLPNLIFGATGLWMAARVR